MTDRDGGTRTTFESTTGGVMTEEAGAVTGELELSTEVGEGLRASVRYAGAEEWYTVEGSPIPLKAGAGEDPTELHRRVEECLKTPGPVVDANERAATLKWFSVV
ncbi:MAG TPA: hypothetical protein VFJ72_11505 [Rubrobacteraceae bacterium]|nr:hypothetical protein [Rubrobacteraceae bacterium]